MDTHPAPTFQRVLRWAGRWLARRASLCPEKRPVTPAEEIPAKNGELDLDDKTRVAEYWSKPGLAEDYFSADVYWLANPVVQARHVSKAVRGESFETWHSYCLQKYLGERLPVERMLSVGCGEGALEFSLAGLNAFRRCDAIDLAAGSIERAQRRATERELSSIHFAVRDIESESLPDRTFDAVWFNGSLHHIGKLEAVLGRVARALKPDGYLFLNEYVGPSRFAFTDREKELMSCVFRLLPSRYRRSFAKANRGEVLETIGFPDPAQVIQTDPSEAIRSAEILPRLHDNFDVLEVNPCGGTLLQFLLGNIMGNFRASDAEALKLLELLFAIEDTLMEVGEIQSHFSVAIARPKMARA
jgi:ubiquinone/menaquinone biosynthesis C-methylase UbiE